MVISKILVQIAKRGIFWGAHQGIGLKRQNATKNSLSGLYLQKALREICLKLSSKSRVLTYRILALDSDRWLNASLN